MRAWIDRTNDGLSGMPADGISLPPKKGGTSARPAGAGSKIRLHQPRGWVEEGIAACDVVDGRPLPAHKLVRRYVRNWRKLILRFKQDYSRFDPSATSTVHCGKWF
jgi:hypothetical protein